MSNLTATFSCASEIPYTRYNEDGTPWTEVLVCNESAVHLDRLRNGASILKNHDPDHVLGKTTDAWCEDGKVWVTAEFRENDPEAVCLYRDIIDGTVQNVSAGYFVAEYRQDGAVQKAVDWTMLEVSVAVGVPADPTVGFYRSFETQHIRKGTYTMNKKSHEEPEKIPGDAASSRVNKKTP